MTTALGIGAVTAVLRDQLRNALTDQSVLTTPLDPVMGAVNITALPPDQVKTANGSSTLNLYLYRITHNTGWMARELPSRNGRGARTSNPPLAVDLHYLLTAHGEKDLFNEMLLGFGAVVLHRLGVLDTSVIQATFTPGGAQLPPDLAALATSGLEDQEEGVRIGLHPMDFEELSRVWQMFGEKYRPSVAFTASVALLRALDQPAASGPPVKSFESKVVATSPVVTSLAPAQVQTGGTLTLTGTGLTGGTAHFSSGDSERVSPGTELLTATVPVPDTLPAGVATVRVMVPVTFDSGDRDGPTSNAAAFLVRPTITDAGNRPVVSGVMGPETKRTATVTATLTPKVRKRQRVMLLLNEAEAPSGRNSHRFSIDANPLTNDTDATVTFAILGVPAARYLARISVDGAETTLASETDTSSSRYGTYTGPIVDLTT